MFRSIIQKVTLNDEITIKDLNLLNLNSDEKAILRDNIIIELFQIGEKKENNNYENKIIFLRNSVKIATFLEINKDEYLKLHKQFYEKKFKFALREEQKQVLLKSNGEKFAQNIVNPLANNINSQVFADNVVLNSNMGHGFAGEKLNHMYDKLTLKNAKIIGGDNLKNGADRLVNGVEIQTKYCKTGSRCISECFENGVFRYNASNGKPMKIEVPSDKYDDAVKAMEERIKRGQVPKVSDPREARNIIKKGNFTYEQAKNVAKFGRVESILYDSINGITVIGTAFGISSLISFSCAIWNGEKPSIAAKQAFKVGIKIGGTSWATAIITSQIGKTGIERSLRPISDYLVKSLDSQTTANISNALRNLANSNATPIYGVAATNNLSKVLRGNLVTGVISTAVLSAVDINRLVKGEISGRQAFKNITVTTSSVTGGSACAFGGAALGASIGSVVPIVGTAIGGTIGGFVGGISGSITAAKVAKAGLDVVIEDDSKKLLEIFQKELTNISFNYLLNEKEIESLIENITKDASFEKILRQMHKATQKEKFAKKLIENEVLKLVKKRKVISFR